MTKAQRKVHLVLWAVVLPLAVGLIVLGWFGRPGPTVQESIEVPGLQPVNDAARIRGDEAAS